MMLVWMVLFLKKLANSVINVEPGVEHAEAGEQRQQQISMPNEQARRPYHALARENAEALNAFLTRDLPVVTHQLQQTIELMNQLIQRQLNN